MDRTGHGVGNAKTCLLDWKPALVRILERRECNVTGFKAYRAMVCLTVPRASRSDIAEVEQSGGVWSNIDSLSQCNLLAVGP